jgi:uncharacterized protein (TIGR02246 family)
MYRIPQKTDTKINFEQWNNALLSGEPQVVAGLYASDATFLPTVSPDFKKGPGEVAEYFTHFLEKNPSGKIMDEVVQILYTDSYLHSGLYNFEIGSTDNRQTIEARFSFVWKKNETGQWEIIHHHSSTRPIN